LSLADLVVQEPGIRVVQCWDYQQAGGAIYERRARNAVLGINMLNIAQSKPVDLTATDWVVFKSAKPDPNDPVNHIVAGDKVTPKINDFMALATMPAPDVTTYGKKLSGDAIGAALWGHKATSLSNAQTTVLVSLGGATEITFAGAGSGRSTGVSSVVNDLYCIHAPLDEPERCYWIYQDSDKYSYVVPAVPNGVLDFSFTLF
jgi:hypothetical protein